MSDMGLWMRFAAAILAAWRLTHLLAYEDGPVDLVLRLRRRAGRLMECFNCISIWVAAPLALFVTREPWELPLTWLALSGGACLLDRIGQAPVLISRGEDHALLRTEANRLEADRLDHSFTVRQ
jgi:hypothetical protein